MPRGIPNVKRDESQGMRYTAFHVPPQYVPIIHTMNPISKLYLQTQPEAHEHVVSQVGE
jgi:actin-related protein 8